MVGPFLTYLQLISAMQQPGCPICHIRFEREKSYLENLLLDHVNDAETQENILASVGYCPQHTWQMGWLELEIYQESVKNSMIYESLVKSVTNSMAKFVRREKRREKQVNGWLYRIFHKEKQVAFDLDPFGQMALSGCYICRIGEDAEQLFMYSLLRGLCEQDDQIRKVYRASDGLCLHHFRQVFRITDSSSNPGVKFLVEETAQKMVALRNDLTNFIDKHSYHRAHEPMSAGERYSWLRALRFFGNNEENFGYAPERLERGLADAYRLKGHNDRQPSPTSQKGEEPEHAQLRADELTEQVNDSEQ